MKVSPGDVNPRYTGRWKRRAALGPGPTPPGSPAGTSTSPISSKERGVSFIGADGPNDVSPGLLQGVGLHQLALVAMGVSIFDNLDFERAVEEARRVNRYEFLFMAAPLRVEKSAGSPLNPAVFECVRSMPVVFTSLRPMLHQGSAGHIDFHQAAPLRIGGVQCRRRLGVASPRRHRADGGITQCAQAIRRAGVHGFM